MSQWLDLFSETMLTCSKSHLRLVEAALQWLVTVWDGRTAGVQDGQEGFRVVEQIQVEECEARRALQGVEQEQRLPSVSPLAERDRESQTSWFQTHRFKSEQWGISFNEWTVHYNTKTLKVTHFTQHQGWSHLPENQILWGMLLTLVCIHLHIQTFCLNVLCIPTGSEEVWLPEL